MDNIRHLTAREAWDALASYRHDYYESLSAMYSGDHAALKSTGETHTFWRRSRCNCRIHVPIASDIAATSADLLFSMPPKFAAFRGKDELKNGPEQERVDDILSLNNLHNKLNEAAETAAALGDVYLKLRWNAKRLDHPLIEIVQPDAAWAEYFLGELMCVHFFTPVVIDKKSGDYTRIYERYVKGKIEMAVYHGKENELGTEGTEAELRDYGFEGATITAPVDELLAVHIANMRPNRMWRASMRGRSDLDGLRDMCDALDESYSSWVRDIRLGKAKTIVPVEYLRRQPEEMLEGIAKSASWEFDPDIETYVAMDIDVEKAGSNAITTHQPAIRATDHANTCTELVRNILSHAGYSPQTFGMNISGSSDSGKALEIREHKSFVTRNKKRTYWQAALESIMTALVRLDAALYSGSGSARDTEIHVTFPESSGVDQQTVATTVELLERAKSASLDTRIAMLHPDWGEDQRNEEAERCRKEFSVELEPPMPDAQMGDFEQEPPAAPTEEPEPPTPPEEVNEP